jgi:hypothetical protein
MCRLLDTVSWLCEMAGVELLSRARPALENFDGAVADEVLNQIATIRNAKPRR